MVRVKKLYENRKFIVLTEKPYTPTDKTPKNFRKNETMLNLSEPLLELDYDDFENVVGVPLAEWGDWNQLKLFAESTLPRFSGKVFIQCTAWYQFPSRKLKRKGKRRGGRPPHKYFSKGTAGRETIIAFQMLGGGMTQVFTKKKIPSKYSPRRSRVYSLAKTILRNQKKKDEFPEQ